jgi:hypothetical protein
LSGRDRGKPDIAQKAQSIEIDPFRKFDLLDLLRKMPTVRGSISNEVPGMTFVLYTCIAVWVAGLVTMIVRLWYFQIQMFNNLAPGVSVSLWGGGMFDASRYNAKGQMFYRKLLRLYGVAVVFGIGGILLIAAIRSNSAG